MLRFTLRGKIKWNIKEDKFVLQFFQDGKKKKKKRKATVFTHFGKFLYCFFLLGSGPEGADDL